MQIESCPNCGSGDLRSTTTQAVGHFGPDLLPGASGLFQLAEFHIVVCCSCGLVRFFAPREVIDKLAHSALWKPISAEE
jgi:predicted nucleic-acid-binding Zn-ribbon protein